MARPVGRPRSLSPKRVKELLALLRKYIDNTEIPIIAEFAYTNGVLRETLYDYPEFSTLLKELIAKKETVLERGMLKGDYVPSAAIFSLKQVGWSDKQDITHSGSLGVTLVDDIPRKKRD